MASIDAYSQNREIADSLMQILFESTPNDSLKFEVCRKLGFYHPDPSEALKYSYLSFEIAQELDDQMRIARALETISLGQRIIGNKVASLEAALQGIRIYEQLNLKRRQADLIIQIADNHVTDQNYTQAIHYYRQSEKLYEELGDTFFEKILFINMAEAFRLNDQLDSAEFYLNGSIQRYDLYDRNIAVRAYAMGNLGMVYRAQGKLDEALEHLQQAVDELKQYEDPSAQIVYESEIGLIYIAKGRIQKGLQVIEAACEIGVDMNLKEQSRDLSQVLAEQYAEAGQFKQAFRYQQQFQTYQDSLVNEENIRAMEQLQARYELDKKNDEIDRVSLERDLETAKVSEKEIQIRLGVALLALTILLLTAIWLAYRDKRKRNLTLLEKNRIIANQSEEREFLHKEMHHRVKNNLQLVSSLMGLHARSADDDEVVDALTESKSRMDAMTYIHQSLYSDGHISTVDVQDYLHNLCTKWRDSYATEIKEINRQVDRIQLSVEMIIPIGLIVNEAICNAVKYRQSHQLTIAVHFTQKEEKYWLKIIDDGPGYDQEQLSSGFGTKLMNTLGKQLKGDLNIESDGNGTAISLVLSEKGVGLYQQKTRSHG